jgi:16S rRNA (adenine1518-N6/adenine1519-N6)-dimethyltransferase
LYIILYRKGKIILNGLPDFDSPAAINAFLAGRGLAPQKKFGQNFLVNRRARERLTEALAPPQNASVWEIGPGIGAMTALLLDTGARVTAFEIDRGFCALLPGIFAGRENFRLVEGDALETWKGEGRADFLLGNLPYNIAAHIIGGFIENGVFFKRMVVTVQREVARRIMARPASPDYSSFSVLCSSVYTARSVMPLNRGSFYPAPNVDSEGLCLELRPPALRAGYTPFFYRMVRTLFSRRRKTVKNGLLAFLNTESPNPNLTAGASYLLQMAGIAPNERAENLAREDFLRLARVLSDTIEN